MAPAVCSGTPGRGVAPAAAHEHVRPAHASRTNRIGGKHRKTTRDEAASPLTVEVHGAGAVRVDFLDHHVQLIGGDLVVQLPEDLAQHLGGDVAVACNESSTPSDPTRPSPGLITGVAASRASRRCKSAVAGVHLFHGLALEDHIKGGGGGLLRGDSVALDRLHQRQRVNNRNARKREVKKRIALTFLVVEPEGLPQLLLHGFGVLLNEKPRGQGDELLELELTGA